MSCGTPEAFIETSERHRAGTQFQQQPGRLHNADGDTDICRDATSNRMRCQSGVASCWDLLELQAQTSNLCLKLQGQTSAASLAPI
jgi:hypothetical protein